MGHSMQKTSLKAYEGIKKNSAKMQEHKMLLYRVLKLRGPATNRMLVERVKILKINEVCGRMKELRDGGRVEESHTGPCQVSENDSIYWKIVDKGKEFEELF